VTGSRPDSREPRPVAIRSLLFLPADRPDLVPKLERYRPDAAVLDLEDAVAPAGKAAARTMIAGSAAAAARIGVLCLIRINPPQTPHFEADLDAAAASAAAGIVLPKYEQADDVGKVRDRLGQDRLVVVGLESVRGVADARPLLAEPVSAAYFGAEDYIADIGGRRTVAGHEVLYARSAVAAAAHLGGVPAIDKAVVDFRDDAQFVGDAQAGRDIGYSGKICIHPRQVSLSAQVFTPSAEEAERARQVLAAGSGGAAALDGQMIDEPHLRQARRILELVARQEHRCPQ